MNINQNIRKLTILIVALFMALSAGLVYWQVVVAQQVTSNPHNSRPYLTSNCPARGKIYDSQGVLLAYSVPSKTGCGYIRHYTDPSLAGLIGYYVAGYPATGIEAEYDGYLTGTKGLTALDNLVNKTLHRPPVGDDIYLTIDERIQRYVANDFNIPVPIDNHLVFQSDRGSVIVTDPHTGNILAMYSSPGYDPNEMVATLSKGDTSYHDKLAAETLESPLVEKPILGKYVPGSVYKTMSLVAGIDSGHTNLNQPWSREQALGPITINNQVISTGDNIRGYTHNFPVTTEYGYAHSDNLIFAQIGVETTFNTWMDYNKRFYVNQSVPFDLPVAPSTVTPAGRDTLADNELAANAYGQGFDFVTPFHMSLLDDAIANDGQLMQPRLIQKIADSNKTLIEQFNAQPLGPQQMSQATARDVRRGMYDVVQCGSASLYAGINLPTVPWTVIAKTGTAEVGGGNAANSWLLTQAPYDVNNPGQLPAITILAMKQNAGEGANAIAPMVTQMYNDIFTNVIKVAKPAPPNPNQYCYQTGMLQPAP